MYKGKRVVVGITGSIAAYRVFSLIRELKNEGIDVYAAMTKSAIKLVGYETVVALTEHPVFKNPFDRIHIEGSSTDITHIALGNWADCFIVVPATNHIIACLATGIGDDPVTLTALASICPRIVVPAANSIMYQQKANKRNLETLRKDDWIVVDAESGNLACNEEGIGHIANVFNIKEAIYGTFEENSLKDFYIVVTAGPTRENIDPVRFISNRSSGRMGFAIAKMAKRMGADVSLVYGPVECPVKNVNRIKVTTTSQMKNAVYEQIEKAIDTGKKVAFISAAAPADFKSEFSDKKIKKRKHSITLSLFPTDDILKSVSVFQNIIRIGFAAETDNLIDNAKKKLADKKLDLIVANDVTLKDSGFATKENKVTMLWKDHRVDLPLMDKDEVAKNILNGLKEQL